MLDLPRLVALEGAEKRTALLAVLASSGFYSKVCAAHFFASPLLPWISIDFPSLFGAQNPG